MNDVESVRRQLWRQGFHYAPLFAVRFGGVALQTFVGWWAIRAAGASALGVYYLFMAYTLVLGWSLGFGLPEHVTLVVAEGDARGHGRRAKALSIMALLVAIVLGIVLTLLGEAALAAADILNIRIPSSYVMLMHTIGVGAGGLLANRIVAQLLKTKGALQSGLLIEFVLPFAVVAAAVAAGHWLGGGVSGKILIFAQVVGYLISTVVGFLVLLRKWPLLTGADALRPSGFRDLLVGAGAQWIAISAQSLFLNLPTMLVPAFGTAADVGIFGLAVRIAATALIGTDVIIALFGPTFARLNAAGDSQGLNRVFRTSRQLSILAAGPFIILGALFAGPLLGLFGHVASTRGAMVLRLLMIGRGIYAVVGPVSYFLWMVRQHRSEIFATVTATVVMVAAACALGAWIGVTGVAAATAIGMAVRFGIQAIQARQRGEGRSSASLKPATILT